MDHEHYMSIALDLSRKAAEEGNRPLGSLLVEQGNIVSQGGNRVYSERDPTVHGEMVVMSNHSSPRARPPCAARTRFAAFACRRFLIALYDKRTHV